MKLNPTEDRQFKSWLAKVANATDEVLAEVLPRAGTGLPEDRLWECMRYSVFSGGKRLRPALVHAAYALAGGDESYRAARVAAAVEMMHVYSLMQDDLPCMDDDLLRHGIATAHTKFDEVTALLASDGLQTGSFELLADESTHENAGIRCEIIKTLSTSSGALGMVAGQMLDMVWETQKPTVTQADLSRLHHLKAGALIHASVLSGAILAGADAATRRALTTYGSHLGIAYQIQDDVLDAEGDTLTMGKTKGKDASKGKRTFVTVAGLSTAKKQAQAEGQAALDALADFGDEADPLRWIARFGVTRET